MRRRSSALKFPELERWWRRMNGASRTMFSRNAGRPPRLDSRAVRIPRPVLQDGWIEHEHWYIAAMLLP